MYTINFKGNYSEVFDFFYSLKALKEYEENSEILEKENMEFNYDYKEFLANLRKEKSIDFEFLYFFYCKDISIIESYLHFDDIIRMSDIEKCLDYILSFDAFTLKYKLIANLLHKNGENNKLEEYLEQAKIIALQESTIIEFIDTIGIEDSKKWDILLYIQNIESKRDGFINVLKKYRVIFSKNYSPLTGKIDKFNKKCNDLIETSGIEFIKANVNQFFKSFDGYKTINIISSYCLSYNFIITEKKDELFIIWGLEIEELIKKTMLNRSNSDEDITRKFKYLGEPTKFNILLILLENMKYTNKDIAKRLSLSEATISYHMSQLITSNFVIVTRTNNRNSLNINKETLRDIVRFLNSKFLKG